MQNDPASFQAGRCADRTNDCDCFSCKTRQYKEIRETVLKVPHNAEVVPVFSSPNVYFWPAAELPRKT